MFDADAITSDINQRLDVVRANMIRCEATHPPIEPSRLEFPLLKDRVVIITGASGGLGGAMTVESLRQCACCCLVQPITSMGQLRMCREAGTMDWLKCIEDRAC
jgi:hypothetical protein